MALGWPSQSEEWMQSVWAEVLTFHPSAETHLPRKRLLSPSTPHGLCQGSLLALSNFVFNSIPACPAVIKAWAEIVARKNQISEIWRRQMWPKLPSLILLTVRFLPDHLPAIHVKNRYPKISWQEFFLFFAPLFRNLVICARPFPPVFGLFFALPVSFVAATGLSLRLFVPQAADKSWLGIREHPDAECPAER